METELKKLTNSLKRQTYQKAKRMLTSRYVKYWEYCQLLSSSNNEGIQMVYNYLEKDAPAYMAPVVLTYAGCKLTPHTLKDKELDIMQSLSLFSVTGDTINASILHAIRVLLDRTSYYMHTAYNECEIGSGIGSIEGKKKTGVMKFIDRQLNSAIELTEDERIFFNYILNEYNEWFHKVIQVDNKTKHNISTYDLYNISKDNLPPILLSTSKGYFHNKELTEEKEIPINFETSYVSRTYELFDKTLEFTTSIIISKEESFS